MPESSTTLIAKLSAAWPAERWKDVTVLVAVSGGADSVALLRALIQSKATGEGRLVVAHFNHRLRGTESDADAAFVEGLAQRLGLEVIVEEAKRDLTTERGGAGLEGAARDARYEFLKEAAEISGARYVATAHTADDQVETILFNILRGTGLAGVAGIPRARRLSNAATIVRPLLDVTRAEVLEYLQATGQSIRDDSTNQLQDYTRNRIRLSLLPLLEREFNARVREALLRLSRLAEEADEFITAFADDLVTRIVRPIHGGVELTTDPLSRQSDFVTRAALNSAWKSQGWPLQDMSFEKWEQLLALVRHADGGDRSCLAEMFPGGVRVEMDKGVLRLTRTK
jgi:tRNA(Ile)-lysidine synthase